MNQDKTLKNQSDYFPTKKEKDIILALHSLKKATARKIAHVSNLDLTTCYKGLKKLEKVGIVISSPIKKEGRYVAEYTLTDLGNKYANGLSHLFI